MRITTKRRRKMFGRGSDRITFLTKDIDVLNCAPLGFKFSRDWEFFRNNAPRYFRHEANRTSPDDLCETMFDPLTDTKFMAMDSFGKQQHIYHLYTINHIRGIGNGQMVKTTEISKLLSKDVQHFDTRIAELNKFKQDNNIY